MVGGKVRESRVRDIREEVLGRMGWLIVFIVIKKIKKWLESVRWV